MKSLEEIHRWVQVKQKELARDIQKNTAVVSRHETQLDKVFVELLDHRRRLEWLEENTFTKTDARKVFEALDYLVAGFKRIDEDRIATQEWLKRHENRLGRLETHTGLA